VDADLAVGNIKKNTAIFGFTGTLTPEGLGNATVADLFNGKTANLTNDWVLDTGTLDLACNTATFDGAANKVADDYDGGGNGNNRWCMTDTGDAAQSDILSGKIAWVDGAEVTGNYTCPAGGGALPDENLNPTTGCYNDTVACTCGEAGCTGDADWPNQSAQNGEDGNRENDLTVDGCGSGTVLDSLTGLCWEQNASTSGKNWKAALQECNNLFLGGHDDWRLPKASELVSIVDYGYENSSYWHTTKFTGYAAYYYWSSTTSPSSPSHAYTLGFGSGSLGSLSKTYSYYVVCVRDN